VNKPQKTASNKPTVAKPNVSEPKMTGFGGVRSSVVQFQALGPCGGNTAKLSKRTQPKAMRTPAQILHPRFIQHHVANPAAERAEIEAGLLRQPASTSPKYLYDSLGSHLFEAITELPEYYPTRTEAGIFATHGTEMAACVGQGATLVDLGAGNCVKATRLFPLLEPKRYVAIDISVDFLHNALRRVQREHPQLEAGLF
jgi:Histidine-specific methyltransferase, SAM-dependent